MMDKKIKHYLPKLKRLGKVELFACRSYYRKEMARAAQDSVFIKDNEEIMRDFAILDEEVFNLSDDDTLSPKADKAIYRRDESGIFRLYPDGRKKYFRKKKIQTLGNESWDPPQEALTRAVKEAIAKAHAAGIATAHCDENGRFYLSYPDGHKEFYESYMAIPGIDPNFSVDSVESGRRIKELVRNKGWSDDEFTAKLRLAPGTAKAIYGGVPLTERVRKKISAFLEVDEVEIFGSVLPADVNTGKTP